MTMPPACRYARSAAPSSWPAPLRVTSNAWVLAFGAHPASTRMLGPFCGRNVLTSRLELPQRIRMGRVGTSQPSTSSGGGGSIASFTMFSTSGCSAAGSTPSA